MRGSVILVNYNSVFFLEQCLFSLQRAIGERAIEMIVVDNHSTQGGLDKLVLSFPRVRWIFLEQNTGFAIANNLGLREARGEFVLFINPDTLVPEDLFERSISFFEKNADAGALGYRLINGRGYFLKESKRGFPTLWASFCKISGLASAFPRSRLFASYYLGHLSPGNIHSVPVLSGAALMVRRQVLDQIGGFDERFFMYAEDIDLCYRIHQSGWANYYFPIITLVHFKGGSSTKSKTYFIRFYLAMEQFFEKYVGQEYAGWSKNLVLGAIRLLCFLKILLNVQKKVHPPTDHLTAMVKKVKSQQPSPALVYSENYCLLSPGAAFSYRETIRFIHEEGSRLTCFVHSEGSFGIVGAYRDSPVGQELFVPGSSI
ncbi:MAG: glycosyltransferase family 2 protein [Chitinophagaceae bacterium]